jgi:23S rRNA (guanosine2251-2'-O)-methyltransferase
LTAKTLDSGSSLLLGFHSVREALRGSSARVRKIVLAEGRDDERSREIVDLARSAGIPLYREPPRVLDRISGRAHHQGVLAELASIEWWDLEDLLAAVPDPALLLALDRIEDPRNLGAVVRTAEGAGVYGILVPNRGTAPPSEVAMAASAGALLHARLARVTNLADSLERAKENRLWVVGLDAEAATPWYEFDYKVPIILVVGSEGRGLRRRVAETCDQLVSLPQCGRVASLNVSVAAGIVLYEALRQRRQA